MLENNCVYGHCSRAKVHETEFTSLVFRHYKHNYKIQGKYAGVFITN